MKAMVLEPDAHRLELRERETPVTRSGCLRLRVRACGVCRTDLHIVDGDLADAARPVVPGHEIVGVIEEIGAGVEGFRRGQRVGVPWLGGTCGACRYCRRDRENLCEQPVFTGYSVDGGFADEAVADARYCFPIADGVGDAEAAPLLCAGLIGYRSLRLAGEARRLGLYGFGAAAHLIAQVAVHQQREVYAFTRPGDEKGQAFARSLGACWAGGSDEHPPERLDAALIFAPAGELVPAALQGLVRGGVVVCAGIHMSDIPSFPYAALWGERMIRSVANLTRRDGREFLELAGRIPVRATVTTYPLAEANAALDDLRDGRLDGAAVLVP